MLLIWTCATQVTSSSSWVLPYLVNSEVLSLQYTLVDDIACRYISELQKLRCLKLMMTAVGDPACEALAGLQRLTYLNLSGTKVSNVRCVSLARISTLETIDVRNTRLLQWVVIFSKISYHHKKFYYRLIHLVFLSASYTRVSCYNVILNLRCLLLALKWTYTLSLVSGHQIFRCPHLTI